MSEHELSPLVINDRQRQLLNYLRNRTTPVSTTALAERFKGTDAAAKRRWRDVTLGGRPRQAARSANGDQVFDPFEIHASFLQSVAWHPSPLWGDAGQG